MATFYRVRSRVPNDKPKLVIDVGLGMPAAEGMLPPAGYSESYSTLTASRTRAERALRAARKSQPFGQHALQELSVEPGTVVETDRGQVVVKAPTRSE